MEQNKKPNTAANPCPDCGEREQRTLSLHDLHWFDCGRCGREYRVAYSDASVVEPEQPTWDDEQAGLVLRGIQDAAGIRSGESDAQNESPTCPKSGEPCGVCSADGREACQQATEVQNLATQDATSKDSYLVEPEQPTNVAACVCRILQRGTCEATEHDYDPIPDPAPESEDTLNERERIRQIIERMRHDRMNDEETLIEVLAAIDGGPTDAV